MTLDEARAHVGCSVAYKPFADVVPEQGVIAGVDGGGWILVRFDRELDSQPLEPWCLTLHRAGHATSSASGSASCLPS